MLQERREVLHPPSPLWGKHSIYNLEGIPEIIVSIIEGAYSMCDSGNFLLAQT